MEELGVYVNGYSEARGAAVMLKAIGDKLRPQIQAELDFNQEAKNQDRVRANFNGTVVVAEIFAKSDNVLVMERLEGRSVAEIVDEWKQPGGPAGPSGLLDRQQRDLIYDSFAVMVLHHRFFQMDAHPGNIFITNDGHLGLLDFGQCAEISDAAYTSFRTSLKTAPEKPEDLNDEGRVQQWLAELGIRVSQKKAVESAHLLIFGEKSATFPQADHMDDAMIPLILILLCPPPHWCPLSVLGQRCDSSTGLLET